MQLLHPLATVIAKSKLLVLPVYPAAWPQAKKHPFIQFVFKSCKAIKSLYLVKKVGFRYQQAASASNAAIDSLERTAGLTSVVRWLRNAHVAKHFGVEKPTQDCAHSSRDGRLNSRSNTTKPRNGKPPRISRSITNSSNRHYLELLSRLDEVIE